MLEPQTIITIAASAATLIGSGSLFIVRLRAASKEAKELKARAKKEEELRIREERDRFYLTTSSNLVLSAERLNLTGSQKKEYVMTWLENESIKAGIEVNKPAMSTAVERVVLIMNDHRRLDKDAIIVIDEDIQKMTETEQARIDKETEKAFAQIQRDKETAEELINEGTEVVSDSLNEASRLLKESKLKVK